MNMLRFLVSCLSVMLSLAGGFAVAHAQTAAAPRGAGAEARAKANEWTIGLAAGLPEDTFLPFAAEIARNLNESGSLRVLPLATPGAVNNIQDLQFLNGIDVALTNTDVLHHLRTVEKGNQLEKRIHYIAALYLSEVHLLVRPEIRSIADLAGKRVGFNVPGAGPTVTAAIIFERSKVQVEPVHVANMQAIAMMRTGELSGLVHVAAKPNSLLTSFVNDAGFKLLPIPIDRLDDLYVPAALTAADYPNLVRPGQKVDTVAVQAVLAILDRTASTDRSKRVKRFVELFFDRFDRFKGLGYQPAWKEISLTAQIPGWTRHELATERLQLLSRKPPAPVARMSFMPAAEQERLFQRFLEWNRQQPR